MRVCLVPLKTEVRNPSVNLERVARRLAEVAPLRPDLVCFPECTLTGYIYEEEDLKRFAEPVPGPATEKMAQMALQFGVYLCFGLVERADRGFYNTAVLIDRNGRRVHRHRKVSEKSPFLRGEEVVGVDTEFGRLVVLICGDLFTDEAIARLDDSVDLSLVPMSRSFDGRSPDPDRWQREERQAYLDAVRRAGRPAAIVNALEDLPSEGAFGGALFVGADGTLLAESPHGTDEILIYDF